jgi:hypothetical protein
MQSIVQGQNAFIYQIYYDDKSKQQLDSGFIPWDNTANLRPDWYEFWVILNYLKQHTLQEDAWYGFLSPQFFAKTTITAEALLSMLGQVHQQCDVVLMHAAWSEIAYYRNVFEHGDAYMPGLSELSQQFFTQIDIPVDVKELVTNSYNSVFSNYVVAKPAYWRKWLAIADKFFDCVEGPSGQKFRVDTLHFNRPAPMKAFIQERFASVVLSSNAFRVLAADLSAIAPIPWPTENAEETREILRACDYLKGQFCSTGDRNYLDEFYKLRSKIHNRSV